jgi:methylated-DNA-[protein]-cysteine S-methyltransferase
MSSKIFENSVISPFQRRVYHLLNQIPPGRVTTYGALARALNTSPRAIGNALRNNIFAPQIPCHRCVASTGYVDGYEGEVIKKSTFNRSKEGTVHGKSSQSKAKGVKAKLKDDGSRIATIPPSGINVKKKIELLKKGVDFDSKGMLRKKERVLFNGPWNLAS